MNTMPKMMDLRVMLWSAFDFWPCKNRMFPGISQNSRSIPVVLPLSCQSTGWLPKPGADLMDPIMKNATLSYLSILFPVSSINFKGHIRGQIGQGKMPTWEIINIIYIIYISYIYIKYRLFTWDAPTVGEKHVFDPGYIYDSSIIIGGLQGCATFLLATTDPNICSLKPCDTVDLNPRFAR